MAKPDIHVSIAILFHQNKVLVGWREANQHQGNKHELPGGKVEAGESPLNACRREVFEEVGLELEHYFNYDFVRHAYEDVVVNLHFFFAYVDDENAQKIKSSWSWYRRDELQDLNFPKANKNIIKRLSMLRKIKISDDLSQLSQLSDDQYFYWRPEQNVNYGEQLAQINPNFLPRVIVNINIWNSLSELQQKMMKIVQIKHDQLIQLKKGDLKLSLTYIASCHDHESLVHAQAIGCEAAFLSPVHATETHPEANAMGWKAFSHLAQQSNLAIYALGGVKSTDLSLALQHFAYGVAGIRHM